MEIFNAVCNSGHEIYGGLFNSATMGVWTGPDPIADLLLPEHAVGGHPGIDTLFDPDGDRDDAAIFALEVGQHPTSPPFAGCSRRRAPLVRFSVARNRPEAPGSHSRFVFESGAIRVTRRPTTLSRDLL